MLDIARVRSDLPGLPPGFLETGDDIRIYVAPDPEVFDSLTGGQVPEWSAGVAIPARDMIVLPIYAPGTGGPSDLPRVVTHELAHIALHRYLNPYPIPRWFDEGYARWSSGYWDFEAAWRLRLAFALRRAPPLDSLTLAWPVATGEARIAYLLAASAVAFLVEGGGERGLTLFLERWRDQGRMEPAFRRTYGMTTGQFEEHWRQAVRSRYGWTFFLSHSLVFWAFLLLLLFLLFHRRRQRDRERLERLRTTEPPDSPAVSAVWPLTEWRFSGSFFTWRGRRQAEELVTCAGSRDPCASRVSTGFSWGSASPASEQDIPSSPAAPPLPRPSSSSSATWSSCLSASSADASFITAPAASPNPSFVCSQRDPRVR